MFQSPKLDLQRKALNVSVGIKEVAAEAGVSIATVSRALRGMQHVNPETRRKILDAAEKLNYPIPQGNARALFSRTNS
ncbi:MAG: LacI family transcriptional regulator, partial [Actinobacteria bacterium]|nr:LacI family transcriptional regulator [Actinomycetota bacterium]